MKALSLIMGLFFGLVTYTVLHLLGIDRAFLFAALAALLFTLLLFSFLRIHDSLTEMKYAEFESQIRSPIFFKGNGNFSLEKGKVRNGRIYFCEDGIVCVCMDENPHTLDEILLQDIQGFRYDNVRLDIITKGGQIFAVTLPDCEKIIELLQNKDWI